MHMADALLSPAVGGTMWAVSAGTIALCSARVRSRLDERNVPLMGVLGAFLFAAQMINFSIPGTGSSGHLGGGLLLAVLLGPEAAFLTISSVLVIQALFFADGGLLALGCNIFNIGFLPAFIAYPFVYQKILGTNPGRTRMNLAIMVAALVCLQLGPFAVVLQTFYSGISALPFATFLLLMQPIHLAIGIVEGFITVAVISFIYQARPELLNGTPCARPGSKHPVRNIVVAFLGAAIITGGFVSWFASTNPDGLEWAIARVSGEPELATRSGGLHGSLAAMQGKTALLPDYSFRKPSLSPEEKKKPGETAKEMDNRIGTSLAGLVGTILTLGLALLTGFSLRRIGRKS